MAPQTGKDWRRDVTSQAKQAKVVLAEQKTAIEHELHALVEQLPPQHRRAFNQAKSQLAKQLTSLKSRLTKEQYQAMVDDVFAKMGPLQEDMAKVLESARKQWKAAYRAMKKHLS